MQTFDFKILKDRALMLRQVRQFFKSRKILEIDAPALLQTSSIDAHIDVLKTGALKNTPAFLHTSPEHCLKKLLLAGSSDIYQLSHVFRFGEMGFLHNPEFMLIEWYRKNISYQKFLTEVLNLLKLFIQPHSKSVSSKNYQKISYRNIFLENTGMDPFTVSILELKNFIKQKALSIPSNLKTWQRADFLNFILAYWIEPALKREKFVIVDEYPASQAALAKTKFQDGLEVAERFEIYYEGIELANGYHELFDAQEQKKRSLEENRKRKSLGKRKLPLDLKFLQALKNSKFKKSLTNCYGVAVGFDRLLMLRHKKKQIKDIMPFSFEET